MRSYKHTYTYHDQGGYISIISRMQLNAIYEVDGQKEEKKHVIMKLNTHF